jgi:hypothetical protein
MILSAMVKRRFAKAYSPLYPSEGIELFAAFVMGKIRATLQRIYLPTY